MDLTTLKLVILYMLDKAGTPLSSSLMSEFILDREYANYFMYEQALHELTENQLLLAKQMRSSSSYELTQAGRETLRAFGEKVPNQVLRDVYLYFQEHHYEVHNDSNLLADFYQKGPQLYVVDCAIYEGACKLVGVTLSVTTKEQANTICENWKKYNTGIYSELIRKLMFDTGVDTGSGSDA